MEKIGLIAGGGPLPLLSAREAKEEKSVVAVALTEYTSPKLENLVDKICWVRLGEIARAIGFLVSEGVREVVMVGKIPQSVLLKANGLDGEAAALLAGLRSKQTESVLGAVADFLKKSGIDLIDSRKYLSSSLVKEGVLTRRQPTEVELTDIEFGKVMVKGIGRLDIGQTVVVKKGVILAVEAVEGTNQAIKRGAELGGEGIIVIKMSKPQQDMRFDIPVVGMETLEILKKVKAAVLAIEAHKTIIVDKKKTLELADESGICVVAI